MSSDELVDLWNILAKNPDFRGPITTGCRFGWLTKGSSYTFEPRESGLAVDLYSLDRKFEMYCGKCVDVWIQPAWFKTRREAKLRN